MSGIYIHIPFCNTKCIYCDFYSITDHSQKREFIDCLLKEIKDKSKFLKDKHFDTIFFGGGTPSLLAYDDFLKLFTTLYSNLSISDKSEITIEANPGTLNRKKLKEFTKLPINRLSFGVQSFNDSELKFLTRIHTASQAYDAIKTAQDEGYDNISLDLIFALPGQNTDNWKYSLDKAVELDTRHISAYSLIYEEGTVLFDMHKENKIKKTAEETERELYDFTMQYLDAHGFQQYEVSNYAKEGFECRHNLKYWQRQEYIGFGPSAASFIDETRWVNVRDINSYISRISSGEVTYYLSEKIDTQTSIYEFILLGLRSKGINLKEFSNLYKFNFEEKYGNACSFLFNNNLAVKTKSVIKLTSRGYALCDEILASYF